MSDKSFTNPLTGDIRMSRRDEVSDEVIETLPPLAVSGDQSAP